MKKKILIILQARCGSNRFRNKILKKINQIPLVVLCVRRLSNLGSKIIVATSTNKEDDKLIKILKKNKINFFRGSLTNVLSRYQHIAKKNNKLDYIVRITSDNAFIDGELVNSVLNHIIKIKSDFYRLDHKKHKLPKGLGLEIFTPKKIIKLKKNLSSKDKEHVTLAIYNNKKKYINSIPIKHLVSKKDLSKINVSIDTKEDYYFVKNIFSKFRNPTKISYKSLIKSLK